ncbi:hypothetical protein FACS189460_0900 [Deltaproteobacteria bacterium]|nr:hypothetical protein FACS189460_0900 [Deltaproteobacteria bacterium]
MKDENRLLRKIIDESPLIGVRQSEDIKVVDDLHTALSEGIDDKNQTIEELKKEIRRLDEEIKSKDSSIQQYEGMHELRMSLVASLEEKLEQLTEEITLLREEAVESDKRRQQVADQNIQLQEQLMRKSFLTGETFISLMRDKNALLADLKDANFRRSEEIVHLETENQSLRALIRKLHSGAIPIGETFETGSTRRDSDDRYISILNEIIGSKHNQEEDIPSSEKEEKTMTDQERIQQLEIENAQLRKIISQPEVFERAVERHAFEIRCKYNNPRECLSATLKAIGTPDVIDALMTV